MIERETLVRLVSENLSTRQMASRLDVSQTQVRYWLSKNSLVTRPEYKEVARARIQKRCKVCESPIGHVSTYCGNSCRAHYDMLAKGRKWKEEGSSALTTSIQRTGTVTAGYRKFFFNEKGNACERCSWSYDFGDGSLPPLEIHHIDNDYSNSNFYNLELLCPNCHTIENRLNPVERGKGRWNNGGDARN